MNEPNPQFLPEITHIFQEERENIRRQLARIVPAAEVDDLLQEVFVKVARALPEFRGDAGIATWLHRIAERTALDHLRSRRHREARQTVSLATVTADGPTEAPPPSALLEPPEAPAGLVRGEMHHCIREYVERLPSAHRQIIELKDLEGLTNPAIAKRLGITVGAAKIRLHRARAALRSELENGCELYQSDAGNLACDRRPPEPVSIAPDISSKEVQPEAGARCAESDGRDSNNENTMSSSSSSCCAPMPCAAPAPAAEKESLFTPIAAEFVALGAAIGANCELCLRHHTAEALKVGIPIEDIARAIEMAEKVKATPAQLMRRLAERLIKNNGRESDAAPASNGGCGCS